VVDLRHLTQKFPGGPIKFQEIARISRSCRHPAGLEVVCNTVNNLLSGILDQKAVLSQAEPRDAAGCKFRYVSNFTMASHVRFPWLFCWFLSAGCQKVIST